MNEQEFNLLDERWICVLTDALQHKEVSLTDVFKNAHTYRGLSGELRTQDVAILRLLLAVLHTVFSRYDVNGNPAPIKEYDDAFERWQSLWELGHFPFEPIRRYLEEWRHRFWLFDPERPFYQVKEIAKGTAYEASKLNGELSESSNKKRLFTAYSGTEKSAVSYAQAARWLLYVNAYDDTSAKSSQRGAEIKLPSPGAGWLGRIGLIFAEGDSLFETLMLNLVMLRDGEELWAQQKPVWELEQPRTAERTEIVIPDNPAELLTLQSRRLILNRNEKGVIGYSLLGGDFFDKEGAFAEQMTVWIGTKEKKTSPVKFQPKRHDPSKQLWREFSTITGKGVQERQPGVVSWISKLREVGILQGKSLLKMCIASVKYGDKDFFVDDVFSDSLGFSTSLLENMSLPWLDMIGKQVELCGKLSFETAKFERNIYIAKGGDTEKPMPTEGKERLYFLFDRPFRKWLSTIEPHSDDITESADAWCDKAFEITKQLGKEIVDESGTSAFAGRELTDKNSETRHYYCAPDAYNRFMRDIFKICKGE